LTARQFSEWLAYANIEPFGEFRQELRHGQQMALQANLNRDPKRKKDAYQTKEFMNFIEFGKEKEDEFERIDREVFGL